MSWFDYSLIKYMPNPKRGEVVNIGLVVFNEDGVDVKTISSFKKVQILDGCSSHESILMLEENIKKVADMADSADEKYSLITTFFTRSVHFSSKGKFCLVGEETYESKINALLKELVEVPTKKRQVRSTRGQRLSTVIKTAFKELDALSQKPEDIDNHKIIQDYPLSLDTGLKADFLAKNGKYHLTETLDFNVDDVSTKLPDTTMKALTFLEGKKILVDMESHFVYSINAKEEGKIKHHLAIVDSYSDNLYNLQSAADKSKYIDRMAEVIGAEKLLA